MRTVLPITSMCFINSALIASVFKQKRTLNLNRSLRREVNFTLSVVAQNVLFIILMTPHTILLCYQFKVSYFNGTNAASSKTTVALLNLLYMSAITLASSTVCCFFFVNLAFNKLFRKEFLILTSGVYTFITKQSLLIGQSSASDKDTTQAK